MFRRFLKERVPSFFQPKNLIGSQKQIAPNFMGLKYNEKGEITPGYRAVLDLEYGKDITKKIEDDRKYYPSLRK